MTEQLRVEEVKIERWGRASGFGPVPLAGDFVVLFGGNESGKTSVATALAWLLAGPGDQQLLRDFGIEDDQLDASLRGRWGTDRLRISATARVPKPKASGPATDKHFQVSIGEKQVTRSELTARLQVGNFDSYQRFYWVESLKVEDGKGLTDDLSVRAQFGGIDPYGRSQEFTEVAKTKLGVSEANPAKGSALKLYGVRGNIDTRLTEIAVAKDELPRVDRILRDVSSDRDRICGQMSSLRLAAAAFDNGLVDEWRRCVDNAEAAESPLAAEREMYEQLEPVQRAIGGLEEAEKAASALKLDRRSVVGVCVAPCAFALAVLMATPIDWPPFDWPLSGLLVVGVCVVATVVLVQRLWSWKRAEGRKRCLLKDVRLRFSDVERERISTTVGRNDVSCCAVVAVASRSIERDMEVPRTEVNDSRGAKTLIGSVCKRVRDHNDAVGAEQTSFQELSEALKHDDDALQHAKGGDTDSLSQAIGELEEQLQKLAGGAPSIDDRVIQLQGQVKELGELSNQAAENWLLHGKRTQEIREKLVRGLGHHLAGKLLHDTAERYRKERQPELLRQTERLIPKVTDWTSISVDPQSPGERGSAKSGGGLLVDGPHGEYPAWQMSFGARSLLFLMLRLAKVRQQGEDSGVRLPVILDDVLFGLDDRRAEECMGVLASFSKHNQLILLTCHSSTADLARGAGANVVDFPP